MMEPLFALSPDLLCELTAEGALLKVSRSFESILGYQEEDLLQHSFLEWVHPEDQAATAIALQKTGSGQESPHFESRWRSNNGSYLWLQWRFSGPTPTGSIFAIARDVTDLIQANAQLQSEITAHQRARQELQESQQRLQLALQSSKMGSWCWYPSQDLLVCDGYPHPIFSDRNGTVNGGMDDLLSRIHPEDRERVNNELQKAVDSGEMLYREYRAHWPDSSLHWIADRAQVFRDEEEQVVRVSGLCWDITDRKREEEVLAAIVAGTGTATGTEFCSSFVLSLAKALGVRYAAIIEKIPDSPEKARTVAWCDHQVMRDPVEFELQGSPCLEVVKTGKHLTSERLQAVFPNSLIVSELQAECYSGLRLSSSQGDVIGHICILDDKPLTDLPRKQSILQIFAARAAAELERQRAEKTIRQVKTNYRSIFNNAIEGIFQSSPEGRFLTANPALVRILGYDSEEELLTSVTNLAQDLYVRPGQRQELMDALAENGRINSIECQMRRKNGSACWVSINSQTVHNEKGELLFFEGTLVDITEKKELEDQLRHTQKMESLGTLAGGIAHGFNNILTSIQGYTELAITRSNHPDQVTKYLQEVLTATERAADTVAQVLMFSRRNEKSVVPVQLSEVVKQACQLFRASIPSSIRVHEEIHAAPTTVLGDPTELQQVILNLCSNAAYAMRKMGGDLHLLVDLVSGTSSASGNRSLVQLTVRDTGEGMAPEVLQSIFDPFFTTKPIGEGTGMGLAVVHGIVQTYGGTIHVESQPGTGTTFVVRFPLVTQEMASNDPREPGAKKHILLVDDEAVIVEMLREMLQQHGFQVTTAQHPYEAIAKFKQQPMAFDMILTDHTMPGMTGRSLIRQMREIQPSTPAILLSGYGEIDDKGDPSESLTFLKKPVQMQELIEAISSILQK